MTELSKTEHEELANRLEIEEPSRELDEAIMALLYVRDRRHIGAREGWQDEPFEDCIPVKDLVWVDPKTDKWVSTHAHEFTTSIDAAFKLVPDATDTTFGRVWCVRRFATITDGTTTWTAEAHTEAAAIVAAALRASASTKTAER